MKLAERILSLFTVSSISAEESENNSEYDATCAGALTTLPSAEQLQPILLSISTRDSFQISIKYEHTQDDDILTSGTPGDIDTFLEAIKFNQSYAQGRTVTFKLHIKKSAVDNSISIYSLSSITKFWQNESISKSLLSIRDACQKANKFILQNEDLEFSFGSTQVFKKSAHPEPLSFNRVELLEKREKCVNFSNSAQHDFIPDDFKVTSGTPPADTKTCLDRLLYISSLVFICDYSKILDSGDFQVKLNGYKTIKEEIPASAMSGTTASDLYYDIYKWIYNDGTVVDKLGIAKNLISIHLNTNSLNSLTGEIMLSIASGYQIYLKDNLKQYIEIKNKISEAIQKSSDKASDLTKNVGNSFKSSIFTIYSFFFSIFLFRIISGKAPTLDVSFEVYSIFLAFLLISIIICTYTLAESKDEQKRLTEGYSSIKQRYKDLLSEKDLEKILSDDLDHTHDLAHIENRTKKTRVLWSLSLFVIFLLMSILRLRSFHGS